MVLWEKLFNFLSQACRQSTEKLDTSFITLPHAWGLVWLPMQEKENKSLWRIWILHQLSENLKTDKAKKILLSPEKMRITLSKFMSQWRPLLPPSLLLCHNTGMFAV